MTLATQLVLHEWTDPVELHTWFNANVLRVTDPIIVQTETEIRNKLGQGFAAIFEVEWRADHGPIVWYDREAETESIKQHIPDIYTEEEAAAEVTGMAEYYSAYPQGVIKIDWDTGYAYQGPGGIGCTELHAMFIVRLAREYLEPRGITFAWQNEYSGEWNEGLTGFENFGQQGRDASEWFNTIALSAIVAEVLS